MMTQKYLFGKWLIENEHLQCLFTSLCGHKISQEFKCCLAHSNNRQRDICMSILTVRPVNEEMGAELTGETLELIISLILQHKPEQKHLPHGGSYFQFHRRCSPAKERKE